MGRPRKTTTSPVQVETVEQEIETVEEVQPTPEPVVIKKETKKKDEWEIKARQYYLAGSRSPITLSSTQR